METICGLKKSYGIKKKEIISRIKTFESTDISDEKRIFAEMCFCIFTPQSKAKKCWDAVLNLQKAGCLFQGTEKDIRKHLSGVRFHRNKSSYIKAARRSFPKIKEILKNSNDPFYIREYIVKNIKGLGYKEASHFLRNIGLGKNLAILDRHILKNLLKYGVIRGIPKTLTKRMYLDIEKKMISFSERIDIPVSHLDLLFWSMQTGEIFK